jgi:ribonuclease HI
MKGLLLGLRKARALGVQRLSVKSDSELITGHVDKSYKAQNPELVKYLAAVRGMEKYFLGFDVRSFPRRQHGKTRCFQMCSLKH